MPLRNAQAFEHRYRVIISPPRPDRGAALLDDVHVAAEVDQIQQTAAHQDSRHVVRSAGENARRRSAGLVTEPVDYVTFKLVLVRDVRTRPGCAGRGRRNATQRRCRFGDSRVRRRFVRAPEREAVESARCDSVELFPLPPAPLAVVRAGRSRLVRVDAKGEDTRPGGPMELDLAAGDVAHTGLQQLAGLREHVTDVCPCRWRTAGRRARSALEGCSVRRATRS